MSSQDSNERHRRVRSFVRRPGRLTPAQARALETLLPTYGLPKDCKDAASRFDQDRPLVIEIGCGNGQALAFMAANEPQFNFLGIEIHEPGVGRLLRSVEADGLDNVRVAVRDAVEVLEHQIPLDSLEQVRIYFPDPWPKKRHHKRRLIQAPFLGLVAERLRSGGLVHLATDWMPYAEWMLETLAEVPAFELVGDPYLPRPEWRPQTHFEKRGQRRGHRIVDLLLKRVEA